MNRHSVREITLSGGALIAACSVMVAWSARRSTIATKRLDAARTAHATAWTQAKRVQELRGRAELVDERPRPEPDLVARLESALQSAGLDASSLQQASASEPTDLQGSPYARQRANIVIQGVAPAEALRILAAWREAEPLWTPRSITLEHAPTNPRSGSDEERFTLRVTLENIHLSQTAIVARSPL